MFLAGFITGGIVGAVIACCVTMYMDEAPGSGRGAIWGGGIFALACIIAALAFALSGCAARQQPRQISSSHQDEIRREIRSGAWR
jgi:hypothetical protein